VKSTKYTIGTTAAPICAVRSFNREIQIHVIGNGTVYLGDANVTEADGFRTEKNAVPLSVYVPQRQTIYAIIATGTEDVRVLDRSV
jgi:hypothetical protein